MCIYIYMHLTTDEINALKSVQVYFLKKWEGGLQGGLKRGNSVLIGSARASSQAASTSFPLPAKSQSAQRLEYKLCLYISLLSLDSVYKLCSVLMLCPGRAESKTETRAQRLPPKADWKHLFYPIFTCKVLGWMWYSRCIYYTTCTLETCGMQVKAQRCTIVSLDVIIVLV